MVIFNEQYFSLVYRYKKEQEFISLKQEKMTIAEYEEQFIALSRFAPDLVCTEDAKCRRFQQGLELNIQCRISALEMTRYVELVNNAKIAKRDVKELSGRREQFKKGRFDSGIGTSRTKISEAVTTRDQSQAQVSSRVGGVGASSLRGR